MVIRLKGELDIAQVHRFSALRPQADGLTPVVVDLSGLTFIDLAAIRELLHVKRQSERQGQTVVLSGATGAVRRLFELVGAQHLLCDPGHLPYAC